MFQKPLQWLCFLCLFPSMIFADNLIPFLQSIPNLKIVKELELQDHFGQAFELQLLQPLNHQTPNGKTFQQRIFLCHTTSNAPLVFETEGYNLRSHKTLELSKMLQANQIQVEYRYYGKSKPDSIDWNYLTNRQAIEDLHRIVMIFKKLYTGKWLSTGISKGGETSLFFKRHYPNDVAATVAYVSPLILDREDHRTQEWTEKKVGTKKCRQNIAVFQRLTLQKRKELLPLIAEYGKRKRWTFSIGLETVLEYAVLEYPFSFWQWGHDCAEIPENSANIEAIFKHLTNVSGWWLYSDQGIEHYLPSFYQHQTEIGYYGFPKSHLEDLLIAVPNPDNAFFAPKNMTLNYSSDFVHDVVNWLDKNGSQIIYLYGELDTWSACAVNPNKQLDALKMVVKKGSHSSRIKDLSKKQKRKVEKKLRSWLDSE
ncbi:MAG: S28 family serine protease [Chitinophagales bacterium]